MKYLLLAPAVIFACIFTVWPLATLFQYSLLKTNFINTSYVGLANYTKALTNPAFLRSWYNSLWYIILMMGGILSGALTIALAAFRLPKRWHDVLRPIIYVPTLCSGIIIAQAWRWIFHHDGPVNWLLALAGADKIAFWSEAWSAIPAVSLIVVVSSLGGATIIFLAGILGIDNSLYDAARMDGATWLKIKLKIIIPMLKPMIALITFMSLIGGLQIFENIYALAPYEYTATVTFHIYREAFIFGRYGLSSAQAVILLVITIGLSLGKQRIENG